MEDVNKSPFTLNILYARNPADFKLSMLEFNSLSDDVYPEHGSVGRV